MRPLLASLCRDLDRRAARAAPPPLVDALARSLNALKRRTRTPFLGCWTRNEAAVSDLESEAGKAPAHSVVF